MNKDAVYRKAQQLMGKTLSHEGREKGFVLHHGLRVAQLALELAESLSEPVDTDALWAAALFHDVGKGLEPHWYTGRGIVMEHLPELTDSREQLERIAHLVRYHAKRSDPTVYSSELRLLQDADVLDHRGGMHVWLAVGGGIANGQRPEDILAEWNRPQRRARREEFRNMLHYDVSRRIFDVRLTQEMDFYHALAENCRIQGGEYNG